MAGHVWWCVPALYATMPHCIQRGQTDRRTGTGQDWVLHTCNFGTAMYACWPVCPVCLPSVPTFCFFLLFLSPLSSLLFYSLLCPPSLFYTTTPFFHAFCSAASISLRDVPLLHTHSKQHTPPINMSHCPRHPMLLSTIQTSFLHTHMCAHLIAMLFPLCLHAFLFCRSLCDSSLL